MTSNQFLAQPLLLNRKHIQSPIRLLALCISSLMISIPSIAASSGQADAEATALPVIKVYASRDQRTASNLIVIDREQMDLIGANNMAGIVKYLPLVTAPKAMSGSGQAWDSSGTSGYNIRGVDGNRVGLDIDGVNLADAAPQPANLKANSYGVGRNFIDPEMFAEVAIRSGTTDVSKDGIGGRVSFKTKTPELYLKGNKAYYGAYKTGYSSADDAWLNSVTSAIGNDVLQALLAYSHRQGHATKSESTRTVNPVDWQSNAILSRLLWNITDKQQLGFTFDAYKRNTDSFIDAETLGTHTYKNGGMQYEQSERTRYALDYRLNNQNILFDQVKAQLYYQETSNENVLVANYMGYPRQIQNDFKNKVWGLNADVNKNQGRHAIQYGLSFSHAQDDRPWVSRNLNTGKHSQTNFMVASNTHKYAVYARDAMIFDVANRDLIVTPGIRAEYQKFDPKNTNAVLGTANKREQIQSARNHYVAPSLALSYQLTPDYLGYVQYHRGARIPTASEMAGSYESGRGYSVLGNSKLKKESSNAFELGFKTTPITGLSIDLSGFYTGYRDFIDYQMLAKPAPGEMMSYQLQNLSQANIWGGELSAHLDLDAFITNAEGFSLALVAGKAKGTSKNKQGVHGGVNSVQPEKASLTFAYDAPEQLYGFGFTTTAVGSRLASRDASIESSTEHYKNVAGYAVADLAAYWKMNQYAKLYLGLNNIFDKKYWDYSTVGTLTSENLIDRATLPGRNWMATVEFKY